MTGAGRFDRLRQKQGAAEEREEAGEDGEGAEREGGGHFEELRGAYSDSVHSLGARDKGLGGEAVGAWDGG